MEDKKKQLSRWFSDEELKSLIELNNQQEVIKCSNTYPNLYSQMSYAMGDIAEAKNEIMSEVDFLAFTNGFDHIAEIILDSIPLYLSDKLGIEETASSMEPELCIDAKALMDLYNSVTARIEIAKHFLKIDNLRDKIRRKEEVSSLAVKRVLI